MYRTVIVLVLLAGSVLPGLAQPNQWLVRLAAGDTLFDVLFMEMNGDSLWVVHRDADQWLPVDSIVEVQLERRSTFWTGAKSGASNGATVGFLVGGLAAGLSGGDSDDRTRIMTAVSVGVCCGASLAAVCGLAGGVIGAISGAGDVYDLSETLLAEKTATIRDLMTKGERR